MTIEIRQLVIRAVAKAPRRDPGVSTQPPSVLGQPGPVRPSLGRAERRALVAECVRDVLRILERRGRR